MFIPFAAASLQADALQASHCKHDIDAAIIVEPPLRASSYCLPVVVDTERLLARSYEIAANL